VIDHDPEEEEPVVEEKDTKEEGGEGTEDAELKEGGSRIGGSSKSKDEDRGGVKGFLDFAGSELLKINHYKVSTSVKRVLFSSRRRAEHVSYVFRSQAPRDKLICILNCCKVIFGRRTSFLRLFELQGLILLVPSSSQV